jgi:ADP-ribose pyrophosphatase
MAAFLATELKENPLQADEEEFLQVEKIPFKQALEMARRGEIQDGKSLAALLLARSYLEGQLG